MSNRYGKEIGAISGLFNGLLLLVAEAAIVLFPTCLLVVPFYFQWPWFVSIPYLVFHIGFILYKLGQIKNAPPYQIVIDDEDGEIEEYISRQPKEDQAELREYKRKFDNGEFLTDDEFDDYIDNHWGEDIDEYRKSIRS